MLLIAKYFIFYHGFICAIITALLSRGEAVTTYNVSEVAEKGYVILNESGVKNCTHIQLSPPQSLTYLTFNGTQLTLLRPLDIEVILREYLNVTYTCDGHAKAAVVHIIPVNEFSPIFKGAPYAESINESVQVGTQVIYLGNRWQDDDKIRYNQAAAFKLHPYLITEFDGKDKFTVNESTGNLTTSELLDYDSMPYRKYYVVNVSVQDDGGLLSTTTVNITVTDDDDNPPVFSAAEYSAEIDRFFQGILEIQPEVRATDGDKGINADITYSLASDSDMASALRIDNSTGHIEVIEPYVNVTNGTLFDTLTIEANITATELSPNRQQSIARLTLLVHHHYPTTTPAERETTAETTVPSSDPATTTTTAQPTTASSPSDFDAILLVEILVPCIAVIIAVIVLIVIVRKRKKKAHETQYMLRESEKKRSEKKRALDEYDHGKINVISSTPISYPYDMVSVYAKINDTSKEEEINVVKKLESTKEGYVANNVINKSKGDKDSNPESGYENSTGKLDDGGQEFTGDAQQLYSVVDKRKPRKRQQQQQQQSMEIFSDSIKAQDETSDPRCNSVAEGQGDLDDGDIDDTVTVPQYHRAPDTDGVYDNTFY